MLQNMFITPVLIAIGYCIWVRRQSWRMRWDRTLTLAILLQGSGFALCIPANGQYLGKWMFALTGISHLRDYLGHLCFMAAAGAMVYVAASRLLPDDHVEHFMRRIEIPGATAALAMLGCMMLSPVLRHPSESADFFQVHRDNWLIAYWLIYMTICAYTVCCLIDLLFVLRQDDRNRTTASLYIAACRIGFIAIMLMVVNVVSPGSQIQSVWIWIALCGASALTVTASTWSWWRRAQVVSSARFRLTEV